MAHRDTVFISTDAGDAHADHLVRELTSRGIPVFRFHPEDFPHACSVSIEVEDVDKLHAEAVSRGLEIVYPLTDEPWDVRRFFVRDPDGRVINVLMHL